MTFLHFRTSSPISPVSSAQSSFVPEEKECQTEGGIIVCLLEENKWLRQENMYIKERLKFYSLHVNTLTDGDLSFYRI